ncbi:LuxR family transcriptional regulator [Leucobacter luti]|nr:LuxR family transcriptional regulator [Leucobacter luti]
MLSSVEIAPSVSRRDALGARLAETDVTAGRLVLAALGALERRSATEVPALAVQLRNAGLSGLALHLYDQANSWDVDAFPDGGDPVVAGHRRAFERTLTDGPYRSVRFRTQVQLTERENHVALLLGAGRSNREIAETLVLSIRTVETHVHRILRKTGARNRAEVSSVLSE